MMCWETVEHECATCLSGAVKITRSIRHVRTQDEFILMNALRTVIPCCMKPADSYAASACQPLYRIRYGSSRWLFLLK